MAHHYSDEDPEFLKQMDDIIRQTEESRREIMQGLTSASPAIEPLGATGRYPEGRYTDRDEGEIRFAVAADRQAKKVLIDFGKSVRSLGMTQAQARSLAQLLLAKADALDLPPPERRKMDAEAAEKWILNMDTALADARSAVAIARAWLKVNAVQSGRDIREVRDGVNNRLRAALDGIERLMAEVEEVG